MKLFPAASSYLGSGCFSRQGIFGGSAGDRQNYCHSWCSRRTRSFESSLGCNTTTFKPSKTIQKPSTKIKLSEHHGVRIWRNRAFLTAKLNDICMPFISCACTLLDIAGYATQVESGPYESLECTELYAMDCHGPCRCLVATCHDIDKLMVKVQDSKALVAFRCYKHCISGKN